MRTLKSSGLLVLAAVTALIGTSLPAIGAMPGQASLSPATLGTTASAGTLNLSTTSSAGTVSWNGQTQQFREASQCRIVQDAGAPELLTLRGFVGDAAGTAGFRNGDIGVYEFDAEGDGAANAAQCFRVDAGSFTGTETLGLKLGAAAADVAGPLVATQATVNIFRSSQSGSISVQLLDAAENVVGTFPVSWQGGRPSSQIPTSAFGVPGRTFSEIRLTAQSGSFSLRAAQFTLASSADAVFCPDGEAGDTFTNDAGVKVTYLGDVGSAECDPFSIRLTGDDDAKVWFIKPLDVNPNAQFIFEVPWDTVGWPALTPGSELPQAFIDFEESVPPNEIEMPYCPDFLFDGTGALVGLGATPNPADVAALEALDMIPDVEGDLRTDGTQFACIGDRTGSVEKSVGADGYDVGLTDLIYLIGDARMSLK